MGKVTIVTPLQHFWSNR